MYISRLKMHISRLEMYISRLEMKKLCAFDTFFYGLGNFW